MPAGSDVRPLLWSNVLNLYDNGEYSAIWGEYENSPKRCLGIRWNGDSDIGYPNTYGHPSWFVIPDPWVQMILLDLYMKVSKEPPDGKLENILKALAECQK